MKKKRPTKLVIQVGEIQIESDAATIAVSEQIISGFLQALRNIRADLNSQGIDTTITIGGQPLDERESEGSK